MNTAGVAGWCLAVVFCAFWLMATSDWGAMRAEAVKNGAAYYEVDELGNTTFVWKKAPATVEVEQPGGLIPPAR